ncbi:MAG: chromosomal replication initiator protein DnaA [Candidatus Uhrbacteria bacterium GW2011_GWD2_41_121]|uniref:Chromosomal replication initiator protein DnaA n=1 Tax=Candidatus Uhrbacteria bacterium GW2011_GWC1_41_20 TaxID=1618983 RepID=A0A0G0VF40_9BACT|nr:MAG: chromosomal replication initiator protein DnaA [Candidatus Uhrbacteria bacterium GW2011_GWE1_39_46]KKR64162.1 MAG: chromosomal replication initiator protein DnaA [Candidatus Uhrbacteria bacterium GW2011_GWC2_40_450]KKR89078.1 MAG: chromosomal replication initiator protein DnaA [Candidatus Uhrbacteria bacterium GW2011_GWE2_41_1153]KKR90297.1 MAG: chromosomal replication initiator protein DnaA [Candidatus Uhrbacteria bacterium GW2011_GWD2_41_121]KKR95975.1 MAG: chromosomal replication ini
MNTHELWQAALGELELKLSKAHFTTWFRNTFIIDFQGHEVTIGVPNTFTKAWLEKKYHKDILLALQNITEQPLRSLIYHVETRQIEPKAIIFEEQKAHNTNGIESFDVPDNLGFTTANQETGITPSALNRNYTFDTFVVGKQNELAYAAAQAVAAHPGGTYNPVFVYGDVGLGKTHLLHAIGHEIKRRNPSARVLYASCEHFTNDFIQAVRAGHAKEFKDRYRNLDLLLIDDIQFITGKEGTQEEFFHTFNTLHQSNKQIVISSDRPPKAIAALEKRLLSRLEWGMLVDVGAPDLETRIAILQIKCQSRGVDLTRDILHYIASHIASNVRELEGALNKIIAYHQFKNIDPSLETVIPIIDGFDLNTIKKTVSPKHIIQTVAEYFDIEIGDILGKSREKRLAFPRQIIMFLLREEMKISYPSIGQELGGRDHTTAMHAYTKISGNLKEDEQLKRDMDLIKQKMYSG